MQVINDKTPQKRFRHTRLWDFVSLYALGANLLWV